MTDELGPFEPGEGRLPPHLAGRDSEQALLRGFVGRLGQRRPVPSAIALYGPRGNGKTALLRWLRNEVAAAASSRDEAVAGIETTWLTPSQIPTVARLIARVAHESWLKSWWRQFGVTAGVPGIVEASLKTPDAGVPVLEDALFDRAANNPLILLLDEAHNLDPEVGHALLNASQQVGAEAPFLLVLAGTPDLPDRLNAMRVSFWGRARKLRLGRMSDGAAQEAIRKPLADHGVSIADEGLREIARTSHGYPFFLQVWGQAVWTTAVFGKGGELRQAIGGDDVRRGEPTFLEQRNAYYAERFEELRQARLLPAALEVARAFGDDPGTTTVTSAQLTAAIRRRVSGGERRVDAAERALRQLGYVWRVGTVWEPGIPSLMDYVSDYAPAALGTED